MSSTVLYLETCFFAMKKKGHFEIRDLNRQTEKPSQHHTHQNCESRLTRRPMSHRVFLSRVQQIQPLGRTPFAIRCTSDLRRVRCQCGRAAVATFVTRSVRTSTFRTLLKSHRCREFAVCILKTFHQQVAQRKNPPKRVVQVVKRSRSLEPYGRNRSVAVST